MLQISLAEMQTAVKHMGGLPVQPIVIPYMTYGAGGTSRDADGSGADRGPAGTGLHLQRSGLQGILPPHLCSPH